MSDKSSTEEMGADTPSAGATLDRLAAREAAVDAREEAVLDREEAAALREEVTRLREETARVREELASIKEEAAHVELKLAERKADERGRLLAQIREANSHLVVATVQSQTLTEAGEETNRRQNEFLATLAHELRNPLAPLRSAAAILGLAAGSEPRLKHLHDIIDRQVDHMARLLDDLLDVARASRGKIALQRVTVPVSAFVALAVETCRPLLDSRRQRLTLDTPAEPLYVDGDPVRLAQVFSNLLINAAKYTQEGGAVFVSAQRRGDTVVVSVKDNGCGISAEALPHIFDLFAQEERAGGSGGGLGIGLTVVRQMVEMHGGSVSAHSDGAGRGSTFEVTLPLLPSAAAETISGYSTDTTATSRSYRIALVDDNVDATDTLQMLLQMMGHEVSAAYDGSTGIALAQRVRPHVVVCDLSLPDLDGYGVVTRLREESPGQQMPVMIALTGYGHDKDRARALAAGFDGYLVKPADATLLLQLIAICEERSASRESPQT